MKQLEKNGDKKKWIKKYMGGTMKNNKKSANKSIIICILIILTIPTIASTVSAWDDCPFGEVNDAYPGDCGIYVDTDGDGICDLSQLAPEDRDGQQEAKESAVGRIDYFFIHIMFILITFYFVSLLISKKKKKMRQHRKIWNILLLITFLISGIFGILLVLRINYINLSYNLALEILQEHDSKKESLDKKINQIVY